MYQFSLVLQFMTLCLASMYSMTLCLASILNKTSAPVRSLTSLTTSSENKHEKIFYLTEISYTYILLSSKISLHILYTASEGVLKNKHGLKLRRVKTTSHLTPKLHTVETGFLTFLFYKSLILISEAIKTVKNM